MAVAKAAKAKEASTPKPAVSKASVAKTQEATALLRADHKVVDGLFKEFESSKSSTAKKSIAQQICNELTVHAQIEEEIFYPAVKLALKDQELIPEATVEHGTLKNLIGEIQDAGNVDEIWMAKVKVLGEYVKHHVQEEQDEMFPKAKSTDLDMKELGDRMMQRKDELRSELGM